MEPCGAAAQPSDRPTVDPFLTISGAHGRSRALKTGTKCLPISPDSVPGRAGIERAI